MKRPLILMALMVAAACQGDDAPTQASIDFETAQRELPSALALQTSLITETCSPNPGVCHNGREYPELHTFTSLLDTIDAPCNIAPPSPELGWDACERAPYWLQIRDFATPVAWTESLGPAQWAVAIAHPIPEELFPSAPIEEDAGDLFQIIDSRGEVALAPASDWVTSLTKSSDGLTVTFTFTPATSEVDIAPTVDSIMSGVIGGDPNFNGVWGSSGAEGPARMVVPGSLQRSYLWRRMLGDVPGDPMPIANGPVTNPQMLALGCWIEGLSEPGALDPNAAIDYEGCSFAEAPPLFVEPEDSSETDTD